ncbi:MAG: stage II sporulation protein M [Pirellulales bacterium]|nr:stage II sporulation protein M [Pirellulales bacterium]
MEVSDLLTARRENWRELELMCLRFEGRSRRVIPAATVNRFASLYRSACADLALADSYQLPPGTIHYLHQLVARAHNQLYRSRTFNVRGWLKELFVAVPQRLFNDNCLRLAFVIFWGVFLLAYAAAYYRPGFAENTLGKEMISYLDDGFAQPVTRSSGAAGNIGGGMVGFYIWNNAGIGLRCFAMGLLGGVGGLYATVVNAAMIGATFGYMAKSPNADNFYHFVTAHAPFELTAIILCAAAGMRLGFAIVETRGLTRGDSLVKTGRESVSVVCAAVIMFLMAAGIEAFLSPSEAPYEIKALTAVLTSAMLMFYFVFLGFPKEQGRGARGEGMMNDEV